MSKQLRFETDQAWHAFQSEQQAQRAQFVRAIEARGFAIRYRKCDSRCSACPHPYWLMQDGRRIARPRIADFRAAKVYQTAGLVALAEGLHRADQTLRELARLQRTVIAEAERITQLCQATMRRWISKPVPSMEQRFHPAWIAGEHCATPLLAIACARQAVVQLAETLVFQNLQYNTHANLSRRGLRRQGALALGLDDSLSIMPPAVRWRVVARGHHGHWRLFARVPLGPKGPDGRRSLVPVPNPLTKRFIRMTGNRAHMDFYLAVQRRMEELEGIREAYRKVLGQWRGRITLSPKAVDKAGEKPKKAKGETFVGSHPEDVQQDEQRGTHVKKPG